MTQATPPGLHVNARASVAAVRADEGGDPRNGPPTLEMWSR